MEWNGMKWECVSDSEWMMEKWPRGRVSIYILYGLWNAREDCHSGAVRLDRSKGRLELFEAFLFCLLSTMSGWMGKKTLFIKGKRTALCCLCLIEVGKIENCRNRPPVTSECAWGRWWYDWRTSTSTRRSELRMNINEYEWIDMNWLEEMITRNYL